MGNTVDESARLSTVVGMATENATTIEHVVDLTSQALRRVVDEVEKVVIENRPAIELVVAAMCARGHVLIEAVPGTGKTTLAKTVAVVCGQEAQRLQCTPDLLPGDITGVSVFNPATLTFEFRQGPVFTNILHADEINRATPKAQSALLEAMAERQVSIDGVTHYLPRPFLVIATQNPVEHEGTYQLPEAQLDRFAVRASMNYPSVAASVRLITTHRATPPTSTPIITTSDLERISVVCESLWVDQKVAEYAVRLIEATRNHPDVELGASPRATLALVRVASAFAIMANRVYVSIDDVKKAAVPVLAHRLMLTQRARRQSRPASDIVLEILSVLRVSS